MFHFKNFCIKSLLFGLVAALVLPQSAWSLAPSSAWRPSVTTERLEWHRIRTAGPLADHAKRAPKHHTFEMLDEGSISFSGLGSAVPMDSKLTDKLVKRIKAQIKRTWKMKKLIDRLREVELDPESRLDRTYVEGGWSKRKCDALERNLPAILEKVARKIEKGRIQFLVHDEGEATGFHEKGNGSEKKPPVFAFYTQPTRQTRIVHVTKKFVEEYGRTTYAPKLNFFLEVLFHDALESELKKVAGERLKHPFAVALEPLIENWNKKTNEPPLMSAAQAGILAWAAKAGLTSYLKGLIYPHPLDFEGSFMEAAAQEYKKLLSKEEQHEIHDSWVRQWGLSSYLRIAFAVDGFHTLSTERLLPHLRVIIKTPEELERVVTIFETWLNGGSDFEIVARHFSSIQNLIHTVDDFEKLIDILELSDRKIGSIMDVLGSLSGIINEENFLIIGKKVVKIVEQPAPVYSRGLPAVSFLITDQNLTEVVNNLAVIYRISSGNGDRVFLILSDPQVRNIFNLSSQNLLEVGGFIAGPVSNPHYTNVHKIFTTGLPSVSHILTDHNISAVTRVLLDYTGQADKGYILDYLPALKPLISNVKELTSVLRVLSHSNRNHVDLVVGGMIGMKKIIYEHNLEGIGIKLSNFVIHLRDLTDDSMREILILYTLPSLFHLIYERNFEKVAGILIRYVKDHPAGTKAVLKYGLPAIAHLLDSEEDVESYLSKLSYIESSMGTVLFRNLFPVIASQLTSKEEIGDLDSIINGIRNIEGTNKNIIYMKAFIALKHIVFSKQDILPLYKELSELAKNKEYSNELFMLHAFPASAKIIRSKKEIKEVAELLIRLIKEAGKEKEHIFKHGIPNAEKLIHSQDSLAQVIEILNQISAETAPHQELVFTSGLSTLKPVIQSIGDLKEFKDQIKEVIRRSNGTVEKTFQILAKFSRQIKEDPKIWSKFLFPVIQNQGAGSYLFLNAIHKGIQKGVFQDERDMDLLKIIASRYGVRAWDIIEHIILDGIQNRKINPAIHKEKETLLSFLDQFNLPIVDLYVGYKTILQSEMSSFEKKRRVDKLFEEVNEIHRHIVAGEIPDKLARSPLFPAVLSYVFPQSITTRRDEYMALYYSRKGRQADVPKELAPVQNHPVNILMGDYLLKEGKTPDARSWELIQACAKKVNEREDRRLKEEELIGYKIDLFQEIMEAWENGELSRNGLKKDLLTQVIQLLRWESGQTLSDSGTGYRELIGYKEFYGDTLSDLLRDLLRVWKISNEKEYARIVAAKFTVKIRDPAALAKKIIGIIKAKKDQPEQAVGILDRIMGPYGIKGETAWRKWKTKKQSELVQEIEALTQEGDPDTEKVVTRILNDWLGREIQLLEKEVQKYEFIAGKKSGEARNLFFVVSKRKAHCVAGINTGVCVATDDKLWNRKEFMNVILFDDNQIARGGMHFLLVVDGSKRYLVLPGINPSKLLLDKVDPEILYDKMIEYAWVCAGLMGCDGVLLPKDPGIHSNRAAIHKVVLEKNYESLSLTSRHTFSYEPSYSFSSAYLIPKPGWVDYFLKVKTRTAQEFEMAI